MFHAKLLIDGGLVDAADGETFDCVNPANLTNLGSAPAAKAADIKRAVDAAERAARGWAALSIEARNGYMRRLAEAILERKEEIAKLESFDTGNLYGPMLGDVERASSRIVYYCGLAHAVLGATYPATPSHIHISVREPFGVVARIVAFNHPFYFAASRLAAPLAVGNTVIIKTPEQAPLSGGILAELCAEIMPPGVVNIISGDGPNAGDPLVRDRRVKRIGFIGSVGTAMRIQRSGAEVGIKAVTHELGGKNMMIVLPDADPDCAARLAIEGMNFQWQGQSCGSTSCLCIHDDVYTEVRDRVVERVKAIKVGDPFDNATGMGPLISGDHHSRVTAAIEAGKASNAKLLVGGGRPADPEYESGYWVEPTLFEIEECTNALATEEIFGPVLSLLRWSRDEQIMDIDRSSDLGLTAAIVGRDMDRALAFARALDVGYVWINCVGPHYVGVPYGGMKNSGVGREEGIEELLSYTEIKSINISTPRLNHETTGSP